MPKAKDPDALQYLKTHQVAQILQVSKRMLLYMVATGRVDKPAIHPGNGAYLWTNYDISRLQRSQKERRA